MTESFADNARCHVTLKLSESVEGEPVSARYLYMKQSIYSHTFTLLLASKKRNVTCPEIKVITAFYKFKSP